MPGSASGDSDPSVAVASDNTVYFGWHGGNGHPMVAVSHDHGATWTNITDVGTSLGIQNVAFPAMVAGDGNRAALAFLGTPTGGNAQDTANFTGIWHLYIAHTFDGGATGLWWTPLLPIRCSAVRYAWAEPRAVMIAICSTSLMQPWISKAAFWWDTRMDALAHASLPAQIPLAHKAPSHVKLPEKACSQLLMERSKQENQRLLRHEGRFHPVCLVSLRKRPSRESLNYSAAAYRKTATGASAQAVQNLLWR